MDYARLGNARDGNLGRQSARQRVRVFTEVELVEVSAVAEIEGKRQLNFFGDPVEITPSMPRTEDDSQVCCLFGDMRLASTHGTRKDVEIVESHHANFLTKQVAVMGSQRHDVNHHSLGDANTAGPMVGLITPAA